MKRSFDLLVAVPLFVAALPLLIVLAVLARIKLGSPILFRQVRPGLGGKPFTLYKLRTMTDARDEFGELLPDHLRLTRFGQFLRKYSLDELLQLWNVVKGELSLVGPRPLLPEYLELYTPEQAKRHDVRPGITGWAQVNGRNAITWEERFRLDVWYVENRSFRLDLKILGMTVRKVLRHEGIQNPQHATMPVFRGSVREPEL
ncbi:sugar transferase [Gorillibacterium sp. sgz500922]|uniref:sugar transferase n=1 Tax=Gorillibacterium sp. sgz500922 TaxID=3446694 RepID=UPI003F663279